MQQRSLGAVLIAALAVTLAGSGCTLQTRGAGLHKCPMASSDDPNGPSLCPTNRDYYPSTALRLGISGRVGLECSVDERGAAQNIVILESAGPLLDNAARIFISDQAFRVPTDWSATGGPAKRFRYGVIFQIIGKSHAAPFDDKRKYAIIAHIDS
jgi:TonB family protein